MAITDETQLEVARARRLATWRSVVIRPGDDRACVEAAFDAADPLDAAARIALVTRLSEEAYGLSEMAAGAGSGIRR